ncbi:polynucleotide kinase 3 phosphatase-domain-containing protein [Crepidotus variabilis]|uniref:Polynucleotide kinase 3 phosphatase-domain-containing protein n=1 Tax=Crepidotus variabilis TaxID=179855 RepID=A0A9P6JU19_9AGAR|nr:polynucleotide kinase 3 phosphatase-domain-containing protein [Crepidotus variabilis]
MATQVEAGPSKKRTITETLEVEVTVEESIKIQKVHPFFAKRIDKAPATATGNFQWLPALGPTRSCFHGINLLPKASRKVAALDLDGTLIKGDLRNALVNGKPQWEWWRSFIPEKLKILHEEGYAIVIISNQALKSAALKNWKVKVENIAQAMKDIPFRIMAATQKDGFRKPMPGMYRELERIFQLEGVEIDKSQSFFIGDAAGRNYPGGKQDFSSTDRKWALNLGLRFLTPEEYFLKLPAHSNFKLHGIKVWDLPNVPRVTPTNTPLLLDPPQQEVVLFIGYPCLGKSTFYRQHFQPAGYVHINQDTLKTREKCVKAVEAAIKERKSCVIDNTNRNAVTRKYYIDACKAQKVPIRCFLFADSIELAWHNNLYRAFNLPASAAAKEPKRDLLPYTAFVTFRDNYEEPQSSEGFAEIKRVNWVFEGSEEERRSWSMWLQIDGK